ncbi:IS200/IS605 family transposase [Lactiplantibacillus daowaiensis]|uniref:IS200/IS605 family transposase n=1 Tax=Lactiplantibacillus daowaiensis TaxID=2559918 RepID=A0ABW1S3T9_9LACO|nr:IS200/IS605 family transposase [Lactiplantibacillus daowaiensis]
MKTNKTDDYINPKYKNVYRHTRTTVSLLNYHFVFTPHYRRKIFAIPGVGERVEQLIREKSSALDVEILNFTANVDHVHLFVNMPPTQGIPQYMHAIKGYSSKVIREEFPQLQAMAALWTRSYFVSTAGNIASSTIQNYIDNQKKSEYKRRT